MDKKLGKKRYDEIVESHREHRKFLLELYNETEALIKQLNDIASPNERVHTILDKFKAGKMTISRLPHRLRNPIGFPITYTINSTNDKLGFLYIEILNKQTSKILAPVAPGHNFVCSYVLGGTHSIGFEHIYNFINVIGLNYEDLFSQIAAGPDKDKLLEEVRFTSDVVGQ